MQVAAPNELCILFLFTEIFAGFTFEIYFQDHHRIWLVNVEQIQLDGSTNIIFTYLARFVKSTPRWF